ncbi:phosphoribosylanthranilate isomerase [candidate division GN15 bacterium]|nr:phosphoribosylanthranilate isomerase [candidate division GN15 bacterium]
MTRVKICGITNPEDALAAVRAGADALGFVFAPSPRRVTPAQAAAIIAELPPFIATVGVFVDTGSAGIEAIIRQCGFHYIQLHGTNDRSIDSVVPLIRAFSAVADADDIIAHPARFVLLDGYHPNRAGGTGRTCDWSLAAQVARRRPLILAGGLHADNVASALETVRPAAVDVSSGVEREPGQKDHEKIQSFIYEVRKWDCLTNEATSGDSADGLFLKR